MGHGFGDYMVTKRRGSKWNTKYRLILAPSSDKVNGFFLGFNLAIAYQTII